MPFRLGYRRLPADPPPQALAEQLRAGMVSKKVCRRIDDFERIHHQHHEHRKAQLKIALGALGLVLGTAPGIPGTYTSCRDDSAWVCGLRLGAMVGSALALGVAAWGAWDLALHPVHFRTQTKKLSDEIARAMQCSTGEVAVNDLFQRYLEMSAEDRVVLRTHLQEAAAEPKRSTQLWRHAADALGVA